MPLPLTGSGRGRCDSRIPSSGEKLLPGEVHDAFQRDLFALCQCFEILEKKRIGLPSALVGLMGCDEGCHGKELLVHIGYVDETGAVLGK